MKRLLTKLMRSLQLKASKLIAPDGQTKIVHSAINGYELLVLANEDVGRAIHFGRNYEAVETAFLRNKIRSDAICMDVGANIGYFSMLMAQVADKGSVHVFEPIPLNVALLRASAELNRFENIRVNECAVADRVGSASFAQSEDSAYSSILDTQRKPLRRKLDIEMITLDHYCDRCGLEKVDVLKADVEGAEELVILGASKLLSDKKRRPGLVMLELYDQNLRAFGASTGSIVERMRGYGYEPFVVTKKGETLRFVDELKSKYYNVFFIAA